MEGRSVGLNEVRAGAPHVTALTRLRLARMARILAVSAVVGAVYGVAAANSPSWLTNALAGVVNGGAIGGAISGIEMFALRSRQLRMLKAVPFVLLVSLKTVVYGAIAALVLGARLGERVLGVPIGDLRIALPYMVAFSLVTTLLFVVVLQAAGLVGYRTFRSLLLGRYRQPRAERRFFLFVDLVGSTALAERVGPLAAHRFLAAVFRRVAEAIAACGGDIYQYVGDEIVVTWLEKDGRQDARALRCFFEMRSALERDGTELRAALHFGEVVAGEVGEERRAIVFHGDVMNAAARLENATREAECRFIVSEEALRAFAGIAPYRTRDLGPLALRGRTQPMRAFAVDLAPESG